MGTTNHEEGAFLCGFELTPAELEEFDYLDDPRGASGYIRYRDTCYHLSQFEYRTGGFDDGYEEWDAVHCDSFFSAIVLSLSDDGETYKIGTYIAYGNQL